MKLVPAPTVMDVKAGTTVITGRAGVALTSTGVMPRVAAMVMITMDNGKDHLGFFKFFISKTALAVRKGMTI